MRIGKHISQKDSLLLGGQVVSDDVFDQLIDAFNFPPPPGITFRPGRYTFEQLVVHSQGLHQLVFYFECYLRIIDLDTIMEELPVALIDPMRNTQWDIYQDVQTGIIRFRPVKRYLMDKIADDHLTLAKTSALSSVLNLLVVLKQGPDGTYRSEGGWTASLRKGLNEHSFWTLFDPKGIPVEYLGKQEHPQQVETVPTGYVFEYFSYEQRTGKKLPT